MALAAIVGCAAPMQERPDEGSIAPDDVIGRWKAPKVGFVVEIARQEDRYVMTGIADARGVLSAPEVVGEFRPAREGEAQFVGRHVWGGRMGNPEKSPKRWGEEGGLRIQQVTRNLLFVQFTDSRYTGGWTFVRDAPQK